MGYGSRIYEEPCHICRVAATNPNWEQTVAACTVSQCYQHQSSERLAILAKFSALEAAEQGVPATPTLSAATAAMFAGGSSHA